MLGQLYLGQSRFMSTRLCILLVGKSAKKAPCILKVSSPNHPRLHRMQTLQHSLDLKHNNKLFHVFQHTSEFKVNKEGICSNPDTISEIGTKIVRKYVIRYSFFLQNHDLSQKDPF